MIVNTLVRIMDRLKVLYKQLRATGKVSCKGEMKVKRHRKVFCTSHLWKTLGA